MALSNIAGGEVTIEARIGDKVCVFRGVCADIEIQRNFDSYYMNETNIRIRLLGDIEEMAEYKL